MKVILLLIPLALAAFGPASASGQDTVRIGLSVRNVVLMPFYFAQDKGFFEKEGLKAEIIQIRSNLQVAGVVAGELDFMSGVGTAIDAIRKGLPLKVVAVLYKAPLFSLVTGTSINRLRELEGKKVGVSRIGSESHNAAVWMLTQNGVDVQKNYLHSDRKHHRQHDRAPAEFAGGFGAEPAVHRRNGAAGVQSAGENRRRCRGAV
ncbi:MAG TPA: ABC transporter substrate-binding protein [Candidatus Binatia bacterium]|nr:ABC transporter substrate-binding protein [Candidatus Binatia bacterium]